MPLMACEVGIVVCPASFAAKAAELVVIGDCWALLMAVTIPNIDGAVV